MPGIERPARVLALSAGLFLLHDGAEVMAAEQRQCTEPHRKTQEIDFEAV
jgi:hypothetical protein